MRIKIQIIRDYASLNRARIGRAILTFFVCLLVIRTSYAVSAWIRPGLHRGPPPWSAEFIVVTVLSVLSISCLAEGLIVVLNALSIAARHARLRAMTIERWGASHDYKVEMEKVLRAPIRPRR